MSRENVELVRRTLYEFMETGEPVWDAMSKDIESYDHDVPESGDYRGFDGFVRFLENWGEAWAEWSMDPQEFLDAGNKVVVFIRMKATGHSGVTLERDDAIVYTVDGDLLTRIDYYNNRREALESVGLAE
jgi:ketosteroid isomerase-like protein